MFFPLLRMSMLTLLGNSDTKYHTLVSDQNSRDSGRDARQLQRYIEQDAYSTPDNLYGGYGNRTYSHSGGSGRYVSRDAARDAVRDVRDMTRYGRITSPRVPN